jgi:hypothetical protein
MAKQPIPFYPEELPMRHTIYIPAFAALFLLAATVSNAQQPKGEKPVPPKPAPKKLEPTLEKIKELGDHLGRALTIARELLSGNEANLLSRNKAALLSGNKANFLSGNTPKVLSENQTPIFSGNKFSLFSNIKVEIHIENSGNGGPGAPAMKPVGGPMTFQAPSPFGPALNPTPYLTGPVPNFAPRPAPATEPTSATTKHAEKEPSKEVEQPSGTIYFPPAIPSEKSR